MLVKLLVAGEHHLTDDFVIIFENVPDDLAIGNVVVSFFDSDCFNELSLAELIISLILLDLAIGLFEMRQPLRYLLRLKGSAEYIDASGGYHLKPDPCDIFSVHCCYLTLNNNKV